MNEPMDKKQQLLLTAEMALSFLLGVFGNKVAEFLDTSTRTVFFGVFVIFSALVLVSISSKHHNHKANEVTSRSRSTLIAKKPTSTFSVSAFSGLIIGLICIIINPSSQVVFLTRILLAE